MLTKLNIFYVLLICMAILFSAIMILLLNQGEL